MGAQPGGGFADRNLGYRGRRLREEQAAERKQVFASAVRQPAEVANAREALGKNVLHEAAQELFAGKGHDALAAVMGVVLPPESHMRVRDGFEAVIGNGDAVSIATEILQHVLGSAEGWFGVDDPVFAEERTQPGSEELGMGERRKLSGQVQLTLNSCWLKA